MTIPPTMPVERFLIVSRTVRMLNALLRMQPGNHFFNSVKRYVEIDPTRYPTDQQYYWVCVRYDEAIAGTGFDDDAPLKITLAPLP